MALELRTDLTVAMFLLKQTACGLECLALKMSSGQENNWQQLLPVIKLSFQLEIKILQTCLPQWNGQFPFSDELNGDINECDFGLLQNKMCQYQESLHNSVNHYFPNEQCHTIMHESIQSARKTSSFTITEDEKFIDSFRVNIATNLYRKYCWVLSMSHY